MSGTSIEIALPTRGATRRLGKVLAGCLAAGDLVVLEGELGAGKTFLVRAVARALGVPTDVRVTSPTFELVHELPGRIPIVHVDLYRLAVGDGLRELGLADRIGRDAIVLVEWGDRFARDLGGEGLWLQLVAAPGGGRCCILEGRGARGAVLSSQLRAALATLRDED